MGEHKGWIGVDLDGTLALYTGPAGAEHIGEPIPLMVARVKDWLLSGTEVRIFTARVANPERTRMGAKEVVLARNAIEEWCLTHIGVILEVTCCKDFAMIELWDDRCVQVVPNTGKALQDELATLLKQKS